MAAEEIDAAMAKAKAEMDTGEEGDSLSGTATAAASAGASASASAAMAGGPALQAARKSSEVSSDPDFAVVCAFIDRFGEECGVQCPNIGELQEMLECSGKKTVRQEWIVFQVKLLRKLKKSVSTDKWEKALTKFAHSYSPQDGWDLERFGYRNSRPGVRLRLLKNLMEAQFDVNPKFKQEINQKTAKDLRSQPLGTDRLGNSYWWQSDGEANLRVYKEDPDEETWELVAQSKEEVLELVGQLKTGNTFVRRGSQVEDLEEESMQGYENVIRDTGPVPTSSQEASNVTSVAPSADNSDNEDGGKSTPEEKNGISDKTKIAAVGKVDVGMSEKGVNGFSESSSQPQVSNLTGQPEGVRQGASKDETVPSHRKEKEEEKMVRSDIPLVAEDHTKGVPSTKEEPKADDDQEAKESEDQKISKKETAGEEEGPDADECEGGTSADASPKKAEASKSAATPTNFTIADLVSKEGHHQARPALPPRDGDAQATLFNSESAASLGANTSGDGAKPPAPEDPPRQDARGKEGEAAKPAPIHSIERIIASERGSEPAPVPPDGKPSSSSQDEAGATKRPADGEHVGGGDSSKRAKVGEGEPVVTAAVTEPTVHVSGNGSGMENNAAREVGEAVEEPTIFVFGRGSGAECMARNTRVTNGSKKQNGIDHEEAEEKKGKDDVDVSPKKGAKEEEVDEDEDTTTVGASKEEEEEEVISITKKKKKKGKGRPRKAKLKEDSEEERDKDNENEEEEEEAEYEESPKKKKKRKTRTSKDEEEEEEEESLAEIYRSSRRTSGRIAALRIKEAERRQREEEEALELYKTEQKKKEEREKKRLEKYRKLGLDYEKEMAKREAKKRKRKIKYISDEDFSAGEAGGEDEPTKKRRRRKKKKRKRGEESLKEFARFSSGSDEDDQGLEGEEDFEEEEHLIHDDDDDLFKSDHEFSCESDVPDNEAQPIKHARTATRKAKRRRRREEMKKVESSSEEEEEEEEEEDFACKKCDKADQPEWILLCDKCDAGWHAMCLRPTLMVIPEGNWFCPDCQHSELVDKLEENLKEFEVVLKKKDADNKRKERLAFVSLSLSNMLPAAGEERPARKRAPPRRKYLSDSGSSSYSESGDSSSGTGTGSSSSSSSEESEEEEEALPTRRRAARNVSYSTREFDEMIKSAIADEEEEVRGAGNDGYGKNIETIMRAAEKAEEEEEEELEVEEEKEKSASGVSGVGRGKDMSTILGASEEEDDVEDKGDAETTEKEEPTDTGESKECVVEGPKEGSLHATEEPGPQPLKMHIQKDVDKKGKKKKRKKLSELTDSEESGDGDSGSDFQLSEEELQEEEDEEFELEEENESNDSDEEDYVSKKKKKKVEPTRRSNRQRRVVYDDDFVIDGSGSEDEELGGRSRRRDDDSEYSDDGEDYGRRRKSKKKRKGGGGGGGKKKRRRRELTDEEEEDPDFEERFKKKKKKILSEVSTGGRRTRGKKISYAWNDDSSSEDSLAEEKKAEEAKRKKKKKRETTSEEEFDEDLLQDKSEEEDEDDFIDDDD